MIFNSTFFEWRNIITILLIVSVWLWVVKKFAIFHLNDQ